jgi:hypothetical protein
LILSAALVLGGSSVLQPKLPLPGVSQPGIATQSNGSKAAPSDQPDQPWLPENVTGAGGLDRHSSSHPANEAVDYLAQAFQVAQLRQQRAALKDMPPKAGETPLELRQVELPADLISDGQFVWGPNVGDFDIAAFLDDQNSNLAPYAPDLAIWASYSSVNPRLLIAVLEMHHEYVTALPDDHDPTEVRAVIEDTAMTLAKAFYTYLHTWGDRRPQSDVQAVSVDPALVFRDGSAIQLDRETPSGTFALAAAIAQRTNFSTWLEELYAFSPQGFHGVYGSLFPESDPLDDSNDINPAAAPPDSLLMFPFPLGATWNFGGPHSWAGDNTPPFSSMDFYAGGGTCGSPPNLYSVASAGGEANRPYGYSCWLEIIHGDGWTTSYYHLLNMIDPQGAQLARNASLGTIACEVCAGGWATGPHVHWSLKYNGAYVSLEGVKATGWTIHVGPEAYDTGYIERDGATLNPWSSVQNDYDLYYPNTNTSLRFYGNGQGDIDRVKVALDAPPRPVDVGAGDLTLEWWMKAELAENGSGDCTPGGSNWRYGNVLLDRDVAGAGDHGDFGVSLAGGRIAFGVNNGTDSETLCGASLVADGNWHHVAVTRRNSDGRMQIYVDGQLDAQIDGPDGDVSYHDGRTSTYEDDPYLVIGAEKHDAGPQYPSYAGWIDELRISNSLRYDGPFTIPTGPFTSDANTMGLYHLDEGTGDAVNDSSGYPGGPSNGLRMFGGSPAGPIWSFDTPFSLGTPTPSSTATSTPTTTATTTGTSTSTPSPTSTAITSATASATSTATATASSTATATASPSSTLAATDTPTATASPSPTATPTASSTPEASPTPTATTTPAGPPPSEDLNLDGVVNVVDVQLCVNVFLGTESEPGIVERSDVNDDGLVNVLDVQHIVNFILTG